MVKEILHRTAKIQLRRLVNIIRKTDKHLPEQEYIKDLQSSEEHTR